MNSINKILFLFCLTFLVCVGTKACCARQATNIIVILADDLGWTDTSVAAVCNGNQSDYYQTPTLEMLAKQGMSFNNAYTCGANCAPMRASFLTGQYAIRSSNNIFNVDNLNRGNNAGNSTLIGPPQGLPNGEDQLPAEAFTMAELLKTANYATAHFGKFHVGTGSDSNSVTNQGFDQNFGGGSSGTPGNYFSNGTSFGNSIGPGLDPYAGNYTSEQSHALTGSDVLTGTNKHVTDAITEATIDFISQTQSSAGSPFFLHVGHYAVHTPINGSGRPDLVDKYENLPPGENHDKPDYAALIEGIDQSTSQILEYLTATPDINNPGRMLAETTVVIFYSDNGGRNTQTANTPLRCEKGEYREGGIRVPLIVWMPNVIPANVVNNTPVMSADFFATFADLAGIDVASVLPSGYETIDGESLMPIFANVNELLNRQSIYWHFPGYLIDATRDQRPQSIVRKGDYKLTFSYESRTYELFDVVNDVGENSNLIMDPDFQLLANQMSIELREFLMTNKAAMPTERETEKTVDYPDEYLPNGDDQGIVIVDFGNANSENNSQNNGDGNWEPFDDNIANSMTTFSTELNGVEVSIVGTTDSGSGSWGINSQGIGIYSQGEGGTTGRRINGSLGESVVVSFDREVDLTSIRFGSFTSGETVQLFVGGTLLVISSNAEGPAFDYPVDITVPLGESLEVTSQTDDFLLNEFTIAYSTIIKGDLNFDGLVNLLDVSPFIAALNSGVYQEEADINCDGSVNLIDVNPFVNLLSGN